TVDLPHPTRQAILQMYERFGGGGIPGRVQGTEISLGARILTVADCFADLTRSSKNPYGRVVSPDSACAVLSKAAGSLFDETVVIALRAITPEKAK
ncbi:MAG: response regulator, partial [Proteobacteria bacterium]